MQKADPGILLLRHTSGAKATIHLHGGHVTSWISANGCEQLYLSPLAVFDGKTAIRGGIPIIFPQFGIGSIAKHGFARNQLWRILGTSESESSVELVLTENAATQAIWPHCFDLRLKVVLGPNELLLTLSAKNTGTAPWSFTAALHPYFATEDASKCVVTGLQGLPYTDTASPEASHELPTAPAEIPFGTEVDCIYHEAEARTTRLGGLSVSQTGFPDLTVWNPGPEVAAGIKDVPQPNGWRQFICIEPSLWKTPAKLAPGEEWTGLATLAAN